MELNKQEDLIAIKWLMADYLAKSIRSEIDKFGAVNNLDESVLDIRIKDDS